MSIPGLDALPPLATDSEAFAAALLWIQDKKKRKRRLNLNRAQRDYVTNRTGKDLILKARQLGFSTFIQGDFARLVWTRPCGTMTLSLDDDSTQRLRRMADYFYFNVPEEIRPKRQYSNASVATYPSVESEAAIGTAGNLNVGRSFTLTHMHGSEVAFWSDAEAIMLSAAQAGDPAIVLESTANGAQGYFYDLCMAALDGDPTWKLHFYEWWWDDLYRLALDYPEEIIPTAEESELMRKHALSLEQIKWRRGKQAFLKHQFLQEFPEDPVTCFLLSGTGYFGDISRVRKIKPGSLSYDPAHRYYAGWDFAQTVDWMSLSIIDAVTGNEVDLLRIQRLPWKELRKRGIEKLKEWHVFLCLAEENSMGSTNIEALREEMPELDCDTPILTFHTDNVNKARIMGALHEGMHSGAVGVQDDSQRLKELRIFAAKQSKTSGQWSLGAPGNEHDDTVISLALAHEARNMPAPSELIGWIGESEKSTGVDLDQPVGW
jgi:hypothetical protein